MDLPNLRGWSLEQSETVVGGGLFLYFCAKSNSIPRLIASPFDTPVASQCACSRWAVSASSRILKRISFGFSAFGRPVRGLNLHHLHFCHT